MTPERTINAGEIYDGTFRLAEILDREFGVDRSVINLHTDTLVSITGHSDAMHPDKIFEPSGKRIGIRFVNRDLDRWVTVWLARMSRGDVTIETVDGIRAGTEKHFAKLFEWLNEGKPKTNHPRLKIQEFEAAHHPRFMSGCYKEPDKVKAIDYPKNATVEGASVRELYDRFRKFFPTGRYIVVISAIRKDAPDPEDAVTTQGFDTSFLEKACYHGG